MTDHPQVYVNGALGYKTDPWNYAFLLPLIEAVVDVEVDEGIKDLLRQIWDLGIHTIFSCQGDEDNDPYVMFGLNSATTTFNVETLLRNNGKTINTVSDPGTWEEPYWPEGKLGHITWVYEPKHAKIQEISSTQSERKLEVTMSDIDAKAVRAWAVSQGKTVKARGRLPKALVAEYQAAVEAGTAEAQDAANATPVTVVNNYYSPQTSNFGPEAPVFPEGFTPDRVNEIPF